MLDQLNRPLKNLRLSVTDRCNLRCEYCMPEEEYVWLPREDVLHFEEISALVDVFLALGVDRLRLTGGEPLLRRDLPSLVRMLSAKPGLDRPGAHHQRRAAGRSDRRAQRRRPSAHHRQPRHASRATASRRLPASTSSIACCEGMAAAHRVFGRFKIDTVVIRGVNDDELVGV